MKLVLDASMVLSWVFERYTLAERELADRVLATFFHFQEVIVPFLWHTEIINAFLIGERRKLITEAKSMEYLNKLHQLPILTDKTQSFLRREIIFSLAREYCLTAYDAVYLDLALLNGATLATFDTKLAKAFANAGGKVFCSE